MEPKPRDGRATADISKRRGMYVDEITLQNSPSSSQTPQLSPRLCLIFEALGLRQYFETIISHGIYSWDSLLEIQDHDIDLLKLESGHRQKLDMQIAISKRIKKLQEEIEISKNNELVLETRSDDIISNNAQKRRRRNSLDDTSGRRQNKRHLQVASETSSQFTAGNDSPFTEGWGLLRESSLMEENWETSALKFSPNECPSTSSPLEWQCAGPTLDQTDFTWADLTSQPWELSEPELGGMTAPVCSPETGVNSLVPGYDLQPFIPSHTPVPSMNDEQSQSFDPSYQSSVSSIKDCTTSTTMDSCRPDFRFVGLTDKSQEPPAPEIQPFSSHKSSFRELQPKPRLTSTQCEPPDSEPIKPALCVFVQPRFGPCKTQLLYRAIYLRRLSFEEFLQNLARKCNIDMSQIVRVVRVDKLGRLMLFDDAMVYELADGQDMLAEFEEIDQSSSKDHSVYHISGGAATYKYYELKLLY